MKILFHLLFFGSLLGCAAAEEIEVRRAEPVGLLPASSLEEQPPGINDVARFIAGLHPAGTGPLAEWVQTPEWNAFSKNINQSWQRFQDSRLEPIRLWKNSHLPELNPETVFYPFSGPDFIHARAFFPNATTYILCGLEPTGSLPSLQSLQPLQSALGWMQVSMRTLMEAGYFVTKEMQADLKKSPLQGTVPVFCFMLARGGDRILSVRSDANHAEIRFLVPGDSRVRTLHYFSVNLRNDRMREGNAFLEFVQAARPDVGYLKSASYLLHESDFSTIRNTLLTQCRTIVQDDSGIPLRFFNSDHWRFRNFGVYAPPLDIFKKYSQPDLADLYAKLPATPLPFGVGYHWDPKTANLMVFTAATQSHYNLNP
ncbi:MAG: hypothetical protein WCQ16_08475 [Verrucomicrobiae bacterium]